MCDDRFRLQLLSRRRAIVSRCYAVVLMKSFIAFMISAFYQFDFMSIMVVPGLSLAIVLGVGMLFFAWCLTFFYVRWANVNHAEMLNVLKNKSLGEMKV